MIDTLKTSIRAIRRDYFDPDGVGTLMGGILCAAFCIVGTVGIFASGLPVLPLFAAGLLAGAAGVTISTLAGRAEARKREEAWVVNEQGADTHIVGPGFKVTTLVNTQEIVTKLTRDLSRSPTLPADVKKKLEPWLRDAEEAAKDVQGWSSQGNPVATIGFLREAFNAQGQKVKTPVAGYNLFNPSAAPQPVSAPMPTASAVIVLPKTITLKNQQTP